MTIYEVNLEFDHVYSVTPKPDRWIFVNIEIIHNKYQFMMVRFIKVIHPPRYGEI